MSFCFYIIKFVKINNHNNFPNYFEPPLLLSDYIIT